MKSMFWWDYTSNELCDLAPNCIVFQPIASVEQHGPHLPVGTDSFICQAFAEALRKKLESKNADMIVANSLRTQGAGFGTDTNVVTLITKENVKELPLMTKEEVAYRLLSEIIG